MSDIRSGRPDSPVGRLSRLGVADASRIAGGLDGVPWCDERLLDDVGEAADPGQVLRTALDLHVAVPDRISAVAADPEAWRRFALTTGVSAALAEHLVRHPEQLADPVRERATGARPAAARGVRVLAALRAPDRGRHRRRRRFRRRGG